MLWASSWDALDPYVGDSFDIELVTEWSNDGGEYGELTKALLTCGGDHAIGFIEEIDNKPGHYLIHNWEDHLPAWIRDELSRKNKAEELSQIRREAGKRGAESKWQNNGKPMANDGKQEFAIILPEQVNGKPMANDGKQEFAIILPEQVNGKPMANDGKRPALPNLTLPNLNTPPLTPPSGGNLSVCDLNSPSAEGGDPPTPPKKSDQDEDFQDAHRICELFKDFLIVKKFDSASKSLGINDINLIYKSIQDGSIPTRSWYAVMYFLIWHVDKFEYGFAPNKIKQLKPDYVEKILDKSRKHAEEWQSKFPEFKRRYAIKKKIDSS